MPQSATPEEIANITSEVLRWRPVNGFVFESLKAVFINAKESAERNFVTDVLLDVARTCMRRIKGARREEQHGGAAEAE